MFLPLKINQRSANNTSTANEYTIWNNNFSYKSYFKNEITIIYLKITNSSNHQLAEDAIRSVLNANIPYCCKSINELNHAIETINSKYILLVPDDCILSSNALNTLSEIISYNPYVDVVYSDEDIYNSYTQTYENPFFKPDFSPDTLLSFPYTGKVFLFRKNLCDEIGLFDKDLGTESYYDFLLRCSEKKKNIFHCHDILFSQIKNDSNYELIEANENYRLCIEKSLLRQKRFAYLEQKHLGLYTITYKYKDNPLASIIIPSKDNYDVISRCIKSIRKNTSYKNYEVIVIDNGSSNSQKEMYQSLSNKYNFKYIYEKKDFNFSYMCNQGARHASGDYFVFLNDDTEIIDKTWLSKLVGQARLPHSGAVGAKLLFGDKSTIQHCGIINNIGPTHAFWGFSDFGSYYYGRNLLTYNYIGVTAACLCINAKKFDEIGGFNEDLTVCYNDVDFCYKLIEHGYYNTVRNDISLIHYESISRGNDNEDEAKKARFLRERELLNQLHPQYVNHDPFYNPNLTSQKVDFDLLEPTVQKCKDVTLSRVKVKRDPIAIDSIETTNDYITIKGWCINSLDIIEENCSVDILLEHNATFKKISTCREIREDVKQAHSLKVSDVGFICRLDPSALTPGVNYSLGIIVSSPNKKFQVINWSNKTIHI